MSVCVYVCVLRNQKTTIFFSQSIIGGQKWSVCWPPDKRSAMVVA